MSTRDRLRQSPAANKRGSRIAFSANATRALRAFVMIFVGLTVTIGSASSDAYLHRGTSEDNSIVYRQPTGRGLATNADLRGMSDTALQSSINFLSGAGYQFVRQEFSWAEFEPEPKSFQWAEYRRVVDALRAANIEVIVVLTDTPIWARAPADVSFAGAVPFNYEIYLAMCAALRAEFPELHYFQIGENLDDPAYWGGKDLRALTYRQLLAAAARGLDIAATDSILISGEVGLNPDIRRAGGDIETLERLLGDPAIRGLIRVVGVAVDGGSRSPYDRSTSAGTTNLSRVVLVREAMDDAGAVEMPVWFTRLGWTGDDGESVSLEDQARFVESGIRRARSEWPWVGLILNWTYQGTSNDPASADLALIVNGSATPLLTAMTSYANSKFGSSITNGFVPPNAAACSYSGNWQDQHLTEGTYKTVRDTSAVAICQFWGTGIAALLRFSPDAGVATFAVDADEEGKSAVNQEGELVLTYRVSDAFEAPVDLASGLPEGLHTVTIGLQGGGELVIGGYVVSRERPMIWPIAVLVAAGLVGLFLGLRSIAFLAAEHAGLAEPRSDMPIETPLPVLKDWKPDPRFGRR